MREIVFQVEEATKGGYMAHALGHAIFTEAESLDELHNNVRDAVHCHFDNEVGPQAIKFHPLPA